jgi:hypothetical protein
MKYRSTIYIDNNDIHYRYANPLGNIILIRLLDLTVSSVKTMLDVIYPLVIKPFQFCSEKCIGVELGLSGVQQLETLQSTSKSKYTTGV